LPKRSKAECHGCDNLSLFLPALTESAHESCTSRGGFNNIY
jgi:hypothetical protein